MSFSRLSTQLQNSILSLSCEQATAYISRSLFVMAAFLDMPLDLRQWLSSMPGGAVTFGTAGTLLLCILMTLSIPSSRFNKNHIRRIEKSSLQTWLSWDTAPRFAVDRYVSKGYSQVSVLSASYKGKFLTVFEIIKLLGKPFVVTMCGMETTIMPTKYLHVLKGEDRDELSLCQGFENVRNPLPWRCFLLTRVRCSICRSRLALRGSTITLRSMW